MVEDYVQSHLAGNHVFARGRLGHKETLSCFDKTRPIGVSKRPGGHGPPRVSFTEPFMFVCHLFTALRIRVSHDFQPQWPN